MAVQLYSSALIFKDNNGETFQLIYNTVGCLYQVLPDEQVDIKHWYKFQL